MIYNYVYIWLPYKNPSFRWFNKNMPVSIIWCVSLVSVSFKPTIYQSRLYLSNIKMPVFLGLNLLNTNDWRLMTNWPSLAAKMLIINFQQVRVGILFSHAGLLNGLSRKAGSLRRTVSQRFGNFL